MEIFEFHSVNNFTYVEDGHYVIHDINVIHNVFIKKSKTNNPHLYIFGQGAVDKAKPQPNFQRVSWVDDSDGNIIIATDPTLTDNELSIGWFQCSKDINYFYRFSELVKFIAVNMKLDISKPILYGSSAGGFASLMLSPYFNNPVVVVNNPQTDWTLFYESKVKHVLDTIYNGIDVGEFRRKFPMKYNAIDVFKATSKVPSIIYMQNLDDVFHYERHCVPFMQWMREQYKNSKLTEKGLITYLYRNPSEGHNPCSKEITLKYLELAKSL